MTRVIDRLSDPDWRHAQGRRFERLTELSFSLFRWTLLAGFARYLAESTPSRWFDALAFALTALLFGYVASVFLLRPEIPIFADRSRRWKRLTQTAVNYVICMAAFMALLGLIDALVDAAAQYRAAV